MSEAYGESNPTAEEIHQEIQRLGLTNKSVEFLKSEIAELSLRNKVMTEELLEFRKKHIGDTMQLLKLIQSKLTPHLAPGLIAKTFDEAIKKVPAINGSKGGNALKKVNPQHKSKQEIVRQAMLDIQSGKLMPGNKGEWISKKLKEEQYLDQKLSYDNLYRAITFKK